MENKVAMYRADAKVIKCLASILEQRDIGSCFMEEEQELYRGLEQDRFGLVIMEVSGEPDELARLARLREKSNVPVIVISEDFDDIPREQPGSLKTLEQVKIMAFQAGADDYVLTNCSCLELLARIDVQLRRYRQLSHSNSNYDSIYRFGELILNDREKSVTVHGKNANLTPVEYKILKLLVQEQGKVISIPQIYEAIWHMKAVGVDNTIAVHICHIREKIEKNPRKPQFLKVVWGTGYKVG